MANEITRTQPPGTPERALVPTHMFVTQPTVQKPTIIEYAMGFARWPFIFICKVAKWEEKEGQVRMVDIDLKDPVIAGRTWGSRDPTATFHLPSDMGDLVDPREGVVLVALPLNDPRTHATLDAIENVWHDRNGRGE